VSERRTFDATLIEAVRILSRTIQTEDGVIPACLGEVATRLEELVEERRSISTLLQKVESLEAEIARLREERRWVPVGERLPKKYQSVIVALTPDSKGRVEVCEAVHWKGSDFETDRGNYECSHWMPLPPGPEGDA
jgi:hypothetical protein